MMSSGHAKAGTGSVSAPNRPTSPLRHILETLYHLEQFILPARLAQVMGRFGYLDQSGPPGIKSPIGQRKSLMIRITHTVWLLILPLLTVSCATAPNTSTQPATEQAPAVFNSGSRSDRLIEHVAYNSRHLTRLTPDLLYERLHHRQDSEAISDAFSRMLVADVTDAHQSLTDALELDFIHDPTASSLDLLNYELKVHFSEFNWHDDDYPGGPKGPNEALADIMTDALDIVRPERRANRSRTAVIRRNNMNDDIWTYMLAQWKPVPGEPDWKLNHFANDSYIKMRQAAADDGVTLKIRSAHRDPAKARANAAKQGNNFAVASFSAHSLGLAIDFELPKPDGDGTFEITTHPMPYVVAMRYSPVHKWLHLHGDAFGWYPFQHEPWHWEFNPAGFREVFFAQFPGGAPELDPVFE
jgi:hypothetical protein